jgi:hypothetical protein
METRDRSHLGESDRFRPTPDAHLVMGTLVAVCLYTGAMCGLLLLMGAYPVCAMLALVAGACVYFSRSYALGVTLSEVGVTVLTPFGTRRVPWARIEQALRWRTRDSVCSIRPAPFPCGLTQANGVPLNGGTTFVLGGGWANNHYVVLSATLVSDAEHASALIRSRASPTCDVQELLEKPPTAEWPPWLGRAGGLFMTVVMYVAAVLALAATARIPGPPDSVLFVAFRIAALVGGAGVVVFPASARLLHAIRCARRR